MSEDLVQQDVQVNKHQWRLLGTARQPEKGEGWRQSNLHQTPEITDLQPSLYSASLKGRSYLSKVHSICKAGEMYFGAFIICSFFIQLINIYRTLTICQSF